MLRWVVCLLALVCLAAAPPNPDETLAPWFQGLRQPSTGGSCCSMSDCRTVDYRMTNQGFEIFVAKKTFNGGTDQWVPVPAASVLPPQSNPTGEGVACWSATYGVMCFVQASGT